MHHALGDWLNVVALCPINGAGCRHTWLIDSRKRPMSAADSGVVWTTPFVDHTFCLLMDVYFLTVHGRSLSVWDRYWIADLEVADFTRSVRSNFGRIVRPLINYVILYITGCLHDVSKKLKSKTYPNPFRWYKINRFTVGIIFNVHYVLLATHCILLLIQDFEFHCPNLVLLAVHTWLPSVKNRPSWMLFIISCSR